MRVGKYVMPFWIFVATGQAATTTCLSGGGVFRAFEYTYQKSLNSTHTQIP